MRDQQFPNIYFLSTLDGSSSFPNFFFNSSVLKSKVFGNLQDQVFNRSLKHGVSSGLQDRGLNKIRLLR